ncbi:MAG TPA: hypothetical protein VJR70_04795 [Stellaceae bacterium]|nr:hypothetical protein [Stellaceae bacterium]
MRNPSPALAAALLLGTIASGDAAEIVAPSSAAITQTLVTLAAGVDATLGYGAGRRYLCLMNIGTGLVNLAFDQAATAGGGWALEGASSDGHQGGSMCWESATVVGSAVHAISAAGSTVVVLEAH